MHQKRVVELVVFRTSLLIGHLKVYHPEEEVVREAEAEAEAEAGAGAEVVEEEATGNFGSNLQ